LFLFIFGIFLMYGSPAIGTEATTPVLDPDLVTWKSLTFKSKSFFGTATAVVELNVCRQPEIPAVHDDHSTTARSCPSPLTDRFCLSVTNTIKPYFSANRFYQTKVWFSPENGTAIRRLRLLREKKYYLKDYIFFPFGVYRYRKRPADSEEEKTKPELWSDTEKTSYSFPGKISATTIISEPSLILYYLSAKTLKSDSQPEEICVFHKKQYHMLKLIREAPIQIQVDYIEQQDGQDKLVKKGEMGLAGYRLISRPVKENDETAAEKFSFMGLTGDITIYFNEESGIPIRISDDIPFIGQVHFNLLHVTKTDQG
ncbi:MAG: hypothetical protein KAW01_02575, partial [Deltaproteobacteria bacterium]|nr:hypothetical protein [Deltaproteobacteria bacterium]